VNSIVVWNSLQASEIHSPPHWFIIAPTSAKISSASSDATIIGVNIFVQPTYLTVMNEWDVPAPRRTERQQQTEENLRYNTPRGRLSHKAASRIRNSINWMVESATNKQGTNPKTGESFTWAVNLITLTLPAVQGYWENTLTGALYWIPDKDHIPPNHNPHTRKFHPFHISDSDIKRIYLHRFLNACKYKFGLKNYIWKVEAQASLVFWWWWNERNMPLVKGFIKTKWFAQSGNESK